MAANGRKSADDLLIVELAHGNTVLDAARVTGIAERTVYRRLEDQVFQHRIREARARFTTQALSKLSEAAVKAVSTMINLLDSKSESTRLQAARQILDSGLKLREVVDLEQRIQHLEGVYVERMTH